MQSNIGSMSSTKSPISSGPTNAGTHNSSTAQRSWRRSLYFRMIPAWQVGEIEFQCRLARIVISKRLELRLARVNQNGVWKANITNRGKTRWATRIGGVPDVEFEVGKGSADGDRGAHNESEGRKSRPWSTDRDWGAHIQWSSPSRLSSAEMGER